MSHRIQLGLRRTAVLAAIAAAAYWIVPPPMIRGAVAVVCAVAVALIGCRLLLLLTYHD